MAKKLSPVMLDTLKLLDRQNGKLDTNHSEGERRVTRAYSREMKTIQALARRELIESIDFNYYPLTPAGRAALSEPATDATDATDEIDLTPSETEVFREAMRRIIDSLSRMSKIDTQFCSNAEDGERLLDYLVRNNMDGDLFAAMVNCGLAIEHAKVALQYSEVLAR